MNEKQEKLFSTIFSCFKDEVFQTVGRVCVRLFIEEEDYSKITLVAYKVPKVVLDISGDQENYIHSKYTYDIPDLDNKTESEVAIISGEIILDFQKQLRGEFQ